MAPSAKLVAHLRGLGNICAPCVSAAVWFARHGEYPILVAMRSVALVAMLVLAGCSVKRSFECSTDTDCRGLGAGARCEANQFCSYSDDDCASGWRYDEYAGGGLADDCVSSGEGGDAGTDAMPQCPGDYVAVGPSKYRYSSTGAMWLNAEADCEDDGSGTHLAIISNGAENDAVETIVGTTRVWLGIHDRVTEGTYRTVTDLPQTYLPWESTEPHGEDDCVTVSDEQFADEDCIDIRPYVCECDGAAAKPSTF